MNKKSRVIRVFLSSTFRDFGEERDLLVKKVFPELRRLCRQRQVELVDVDLRWGITVEEAEQGKVLPICLAEIDRARPYFMGFIGERYGWVPEESEYPEVVVEREPWLKEHQGGKSVTELEMLHGVLNNPEMAGRAFFYFRDKDYSLSKGGDYEPESPEHAAKLDKLRDRLRESEFPVVEDYPTPEALAERVREDLLKVIEEDYPEEEVPDALTLERMRHDAYGAARALRDAEGRRLYLGGEKYLKALDEAVAREGGDSRPVLVTGDPGVGKSALLANWVEGYAANHYGDSDVHMLVHHTSASAHAADPLRMVRRLIHEITAVTGDSLEPETDADKLLEQVPTVLAMASAHATKGGKKSGKKGGGQWLIVLDGLDKLTSHGELRWFPRMVPEGVKLVVSCAKEETAGRLRDMLEWEDLEVGLFSKERSREFIGTYLGRFRKTLPADLVDRAMTHPLATNPLWLLTLLEELRLFGKHEEVEERLETLLSDPPGKAEGEEPHIDDLFEHVLARIEEDIDEDYEVEAFKALWASYDGLTRDELLDLTGMPPAKWSEIQNALDENLFEASGLITFGNDFIRKAVEDKYLTYVDDKKAIHRRMGDYFTNRAHGEGVPWKSEDHRAFSLNLLHYIKAGSYRDVEKCLMDFSYGVERLRGDRESKDVLPENYCLDALIGDVHELSRVRDQLAEELSCWVDFIVTNALILKTGHAPHQAFLQLAYELADESPVTKAAEAWLESDQCDWLWMSKLHRPTRTSASFDPVAILPVGAEGVVSFGEDLIYTWNEQRIQRWDMKSLTHEDIGENPKCALAGKDQKHLIAVYNDRVCWVDSENTMKIETWMWDDHREGEASLNGGLLLEDGRLLSWSDNQKECQIWSWEEGFVGSWSELWVPEISQAEELTTFRGYLPLDGSRLLVWGMPQGEIGVWNLSEGKFVHLWLAHPEGKDEDDDCWNCMMASKLDSGDIMTHSYTDDGSVVRVWSQESYELISEHTIDMGFSNVVPASGTHFFVLDHYLNDESPCQSYLFDYKNLGKKGLCFERIGGFKKLSSGEILLWKASAEVITYNFLVDLQLMDSDGGLLWETVGAHEITAALTTRHALDLAEVDGSRVVSYSSVDKSVKVWDLCRNREEQYGGGKDGDRFEINIPEPMASVDFDGEIARARRCAYRKEKIRDAYTYDIGGDTQLTISVSYRTKMTPDEEQDVIGRAWIHQAGEDASMGREVGDLKHGGIATSLVQLFSNGAQFVWNYQYMDNQKFDLFYHHVYPRVDALAISGTDDTANESVFQAVRVVTSGHKVHLYRCGDDGWPTLTWVGQTYWQSVCILGDGSIALRSFSGQEIRLGLFLGNKRLGGQEIANFQSPESDKLPDSSHRGEFTDFNKNITDVIQSLTEREREILEQRFGLKGIARTLDEVSDQFKLTRERIRQIEAKALRKMRHPSRVRKLEEFIKLPPTDGVDKSVDCKVNTVKTEPSAEKDLGNEDANAPESLEKGEGKLISLADLIRVNLGEEDSTKNN